MAAGAKRQARIEPELDTASGLPIPTGHHPEPIRKTARLPVLRMGEALGRWQSGGVGSGDIGPGYQTQ